MDNLQTLSNYFSFQGPNINIFGFVADVFLTAILASLLSVIYIKFGNSLSYKKSLASNFVLLAVTTMLVITIVKTSLALSLGLVGALSIVRFRAAIKEPEELTYLFLAIAIGLGIGANQRIVTLTAFIAIAVIIAGKDLLVKTENINSNLFLKLNSKEPIEIKNIVNLLKDYTTSANLNRYQQDQNTNELLFLVNFDSVDNLTQFKDKVKEKYENMEITFFEDKGIFN